MLTRQVRHLYHKFGGNICRRMEAGTTARPFAGLKGLIQTGMLFGKEGAEPSV